MTSNRTSFDQLPDLPVKDVIPDLLTALESTGNAVLVAPPGAGKTTLVPLALLDAKWRQNRKIIVLEPRRLAARAAANRMSELLGAKVGEQVGYRVRFDTKVSARTCIEVVTEGVFLRMLHENPGLDNVAAVLFDEFHERSLDGDLSLALCLYLKNGLRDDLRLLPMSATLDGAAIASLIGADIIESQGRQHPVEIDYTEIRPRETLETALLNVIMEECARPQKCGVLVFLPGQREIEKMAGVLEGKLDQSNISLHRLYGAISSREQDDAIRPAASGKQKIVLASAIAETSITIDGIDLVIDSGWARLPVFDAASGLTRLETVRASKAAITQRAGRAGRLRPGRAIRLWRKEQTAALPAFAPPEIQNADLSDLLLTLLDWGIGDVDELRWLAPPPPGPLKEARQALEEMGAINDNRLTEHGRNINALPLPNNLAHMVLKGAQYGCSLMAAQLAYLLQEQYLGGRNVDLSLRFENLARQKDASTQKLKQSALKLSKNASQKSTVSTKKNMSVGALLAFAHPGRVAQKGGYTENGMVRFKLANGRGALLPADEALSKEEFIVISDMAGRAGAARILSAAPLEKAELQTVFKTTIQEVRESRFDEKNGKLSVQLTKRFGALDLERPRRVEPLEVDIQTALLSAVRKHGLDKLPWNDAAKSLLERLQFLHHHDPENWLSCCNEALLDDLEVWLVPFLIGVSDFKSIPKTALRDGLMLRIGIGRDGEISSLSPTHFKTPSGSNIALRYEQDKVILAVRPQELFGLDQHPCLLNGAIAMDIQLLSPAGRPIQITQDLPGFWRGSWKDVRADLRGRYPKHPWPEDPLNAPPTNRVKPRK